MVYKVYKHDPSRKQPGMWFSLDTSFSYFRSPHAAIEAVKRFGVKGGIYVVRGPQEFYETIEL